MMEYNDSDKKGGLSAAERARLSEENAFVREKKSGRRKADKPQRTGAVSSRKGKNSKKDSSAGEKSRNDRVKSSTRQRKRDAKRQNNILAVMLFAVAFALICVVSVFVLKVNTVEVINPEERYQSALVSEKAGIKEGASMLLINGKKAEAVIEKEFPYVENAVIKRKWPDKIIIGLEYATPAMAIDTGRAYVILNDSCKVLSADAATYPKSAALIKGVKIVSAVPGETAVFTDDLSISQVSSLSQSLSECGFTGITSYDLTKISDITIFIDNRVEVKLGTLAGASDKLRFGKEVIARTAEEDTEHAMVVDLTTDGEAYVRVKNDNNISYSEPAEETTAAPEEDPSEAASSEASSVPAVG